MWEFVGRGPFYACHCEERSDVAISFDDGDVRFKMGIATPV